MDVKALVQFARIGGPMDRRIRIVAVVVVLFLTFGSMFLASDQFSVDIWLEWLLG